MTRCYFVTPFVKLFTVVPCDNFQEPVFFRLLPCKCEDQVVNNVVAFAEAEPMLYS